MLIITHMHNVIFIRVLMFIVFAISIHMRTNTHIHMRTNICIQTIIHTSTNTCMQIPINILKFASTACSRIFTCIHTCLHICIHMLMHILIHVFTQTRQQTQAHIHIHLHRLRQLLEIQKAQKQKLIRAQKLHQ